MTPELIEVIAGVVLVSVGILLIIKGIRQLRTAGYDAYRRCLRVVGIACVVAVALIAVIGGLYCGRFLLTHTAYFSVTVAAWAQRPLTLLIPAVPRPAAPAERQLRVHVRIQRWHWHHTDTWLSADQLRDLVEQCRLLAAELDEREALVPDDALPRLVDQKAIALLDDAWERKRAEARALYPDADQQDGSA